ncbi:MAG: enoyl-ACP reductase [Deltaproteobacteria bacterium]|nr:enoyl-ACP reductase [Deltaproteobacteria bacterium]
MKLLEGKKGLIMGVANQKSIAWGVAEACHQHGAELAFTYLNETLERRVRPLAESLGSTFLLPCDVQRDDEIQAVFTSIEKEWGKLDFLVHSVAFAKGEDLNNRFSLTSREGFHLAMDVSVYSFIKTMACAKNVLGKDSSALTMSYYGAQKVVPNYRMMGVAKAALEASVRELAVDLGPDQVRVNAISAGPIKTLAASGISDFRDLLNYFEPRAPLRRLISIENVGSSAVYLLSDLASAVTGEVHYVDCGFNVTAA